MLKGLKQARKNTYQKMLTGCGRKEEEKEGKWKEGRKYICIILHVPMVLTNIDIMIAQFINIKSSIKKKKGQNHTDHIGVDITQ